MANMSDADYQFILCCLKHSQGKPDFHAVAKELGLKTHTTAYHRHWTIMKKAGMAGNRGKDRRIGRGTTATYCGGGLRKKRGHLLKSTPKASDEDSGKEQDQENEIKPELEPEDETDEAVEMPVKKTKASQSRASEAVMMELA